MKKTYIVVGLIFLAAGCSKTVTEQSSVNLTSQAICAESAAKYFKNNNIININNLSSAESVSYTNHYNRELNKCFIVMHKNDLGISMLNDYYGLVDIFENKVIVDTIFPAPSYNQPKPGCNSNFESFRGYTATSCSDLTNFNAFIKPYMAN